MMIDSQERIIYIGKSKNLITRIRSYFRLNSEHSPRIRLMVNQIHDIQFIVTDNESEALNLEDNLIKSNQPYFNILLKDDKKYPYVCITWGAKYPRIYITRNKRSKNYKDKYYGPYVDVNLLRKTLFLIKSVFPLRQRQIPLYKDRTCLNYSIDRCPGVCQEKITPESYNQILKKVEMIFQGRSFELEKILKEKMLKYSKELQYEKASLVRDQIKGIQHISESQKMTLSDDSTSRDIINIAKEDSLYSIQIFQMRAGKLVARIGYISSTNCSSSKEVLQKTIEEHYSGIDSIEIPNDILTGHKLTQEVLIQEWLSELKGLKVYITNPTKGIKAEMIKLVHKNAEYELKRIKLGRDKNNLALEDLANLLELKNSPKRIEGYDISHIQGSNAVGSQVVFIDGIPAKQHYRKYKINDITIKTGYNNDYISLAEIIKRRFLKWSRFVKQGGEIDKINLKSQTVLDSSNLNDWPDLVLIDGGKGQLNSVVKVLTELELIDKINICSLAKQNEEVFVPNIIDPLDTDKEDSSIQLLRRVRDESHRFALSFHKHRRSKYMTKSKLNNIPGLGKKRVNDLINHFNSVESIQLASIDEINKVPGLGKAISTTIWKYFHSE